MVIAKNYGRMGNVLFQNAVGIAYSLKHDLEFTVPNETNDRIWNPLYLQNLVNPNWNPKLPNAVIKEQSHAFQELPFYENWRHDVNIILEGYFQSYKYFSWCREDVLRLFGFNWKLSDERQIAIHVRRGDYLKYPEKHPVMSEKYLEQAIKVFNEAGYNQFLVFSDDIPFCQETITTDRYPGNLFSYSIGNNEVRDLELMSGCHGGIGSASTFAWWANWLNKKEDKIIVTPDESSWFGPDYAHHDVSTLLPKDWIRIKY